MAAERKIGETTFRADKLPPREAQRLFLRLSRILGPAVQTMGEVLTEEDEAERDRKALMLIGTFLQNMDIEDADDLLVSICSSAQVNEDGEYTDIIFDVHFDDLVTAWMVGLFVLEVQFKNFFDAVSKSTVGKKVAGRLQTAK